MKLEKVTIEALKELVQHLDEHNIRYVIFGAMCPIILIDLKDETGRGYNARTTKDVDFLVEVDTWREYNELLESLQERGFERKNRNIEHRLYWKNQEMDLNDKIQFSERRYDTIIPIELPYESRGAYLLGNDLKQVPSSRNIEKFNDSFQHCHHF